MESLAYVLILVVLLRCLVIVERVLFANDAAPAARLAMLLEIAGRWMGTNRMGRWG
jgi:hypothetical protein